MMVSLWPFHKDDNSPETFGKALSQLSAKITATQTQLDRTRASHRRLKFLSTLYLSFGYLVYAVVAFLVVGWKNMGIYEWTGMAGGPVLIYLVRTAASTVYELRIEALNSKLKSQQATQAKTIQRLKDATKYDSTAELLEKYGGGGGGSRAKKRSKDDEQDEAAKKSPKAQRPQSSGPSNRTHLPIPATANIQRPSTSSGIPHSGPGPQQQPQQHRLPPPSRAPLEPTAEFSPNAFDGSRPQPPPGQYETQNRWYDRIIDLLLGEDETASKNRMVLICQRCRLVNGQAPPGTNSLAELGLWRCMGCGESNGEADEGKKLVNEVLSQHSERGLSTDDGSSSDLVEVLSVEPPTEDDEDVQETQEGTSGLTKRKGKAGN